MSNMTKQIIKVASEIAQNVSKNMRIANEADGLGCRELDFLNMENRAFRAAVEVLSNHPLLDPDFAPITVDLGLFPPQPAPDTDKVKVNSGNVQDLYKQQIEDGCFDGLKLVHLPTDIKRWVSPIDGKPHFVDDEGWIYARGYNPVKSDTILTDRQYMAEFKVNKYKEGAVPAEAAFWLGLLRFKLA